MSISNPRRLLAAFIAILFTVATTQAQAPQLMSFQSVIRNSSGTLVTNHSVGLRLSILQGSITGTSVYTETQTATSNANGLVTLQVGGGTVVSGTFSSIDWSAGPYYIKSEIDPTGGTTYGIAGTTQLLSVAYALYAEKSGTAGPVEATGVGITNVKVNGDSLYITLSDGKIINAGYVRGATGGVSGHHIGESYGGGTVFYTYNNGQNGLIVATSENFGSITFGGNNRYSTYLGDGIGAGSSNTTTLTSGSNFSFDKFISSYATSFSTTQNGITYGNWYIPSAYELNLLYNQKSILSNVTQMTYYVSSTSSYVANGGYPYYPTIFLNFNDGNQITNQSGLSFGVLVIRAF